MYTVSFFGHRVIEDSLDAERKLERVICHLLRVHDYVEFLVGRDGEFDILAASIVHRCRKIVRRDNSALIWIAPYETADLRDDLDSFLQYYDDVEICTSAQTGYFKVAHQHRNQEMVRRSDEVFFYVSRPQGGTYQTMRYADKIGKPVTNLTVLSQIK